MENITVKVKGGEGINITNGTDTFFVDKIKAGGQKRILVRFDTAAELASVSQTSMLSLSTATTRAALLRPRPRPARSA
ncbi:MAG: hypothetical protein ACLSG5_02965 [Oscillospiraceae bacterium]